MKIINARHLWPESAGFTLERKHGSGDYILLHFVNSVELLYRGERLVTSPDAVIIFSPECPQWLCSHQPLVHNWAHITGNVEEILFAYDLAVNTLYYPSNGLTITRLVEEMELEILSEKLYADEFNDLKIQEIFLRLSRNLVAETSDITISSDLYETFRNVRAEMVSNLERPWKIAELAQNVHLSESRFYVVYKQIFGITPNNDIVLARVEKAKRLLLLNRYSNAQIAEMTGYSNEYHFIRQFKKITGVTPQRFSKLK